MNDINKSLSLFLSMISNRKYIFSFFKEIHKHFTLSAPNVISHAALMLYKYSVLNLMATWIFMKMYVGNLSV